MAGSVPRIWKQGEGRRFVKSYAYGVEDHLAMRYGRTEALAYWPFTIGVTLVAFFVGLIFAYDSWWQNQREWALGIAVGSIVAGLAVARLSYGFFKGFARGFWEGALKRNEALDVALEVTIDEGGITVGIRQQTWSCPWESLLSVEEDADRYYFWTSKTQAHVLPKRVFEGEERREFAETLREWLGSEPVSPPRMAGRAHFDWGEQPKTAA